MTDVGLPPGQCEVDDFPRFGLRQFANRFPTQIDEISLKIIGDVEAPITVSTEFGRLARVEQVSGFHCVTTWSRHSLRWGGVQFSEFYRRIVIPEARPAPGATFVVLRCQDGYAASLPLEDLLASDVLLADRLNGEALSLAHGAPLRLVAPARYGYKNAKHLRAIEFRRDASHYRSSVFPFRFMDHPRARVVLEERGRAVPGWLLRYLYRPLVRPTIRQFRAALDRHVNAKRRDFPVD